MFLQIYRWMESELLLIIFRKYLLIEKNVSPLVIADQSLLIQQHLAPLYRNSMDVLHSLNNFPLRFMIFPLDRVDDRIQVLLSFSIPIN